MKLKKRSSLTNKGRGFLGVTSLFLREEIPQKGGHRRSTLVERGKGKK